MILSGIADHRTLEGISLALGEYDRQLVSHSKQLSRTGLLGPATHAAPGRDRRAAPRPRPPAQRRQMGPAAPHPLAPSRALARRRRHPTPTASSTRGAPAAAALAACAPARHPPSSRSWSRQGP
jgi:hypothetical protein